MTSVLVYRERTLSSPLFVTCSFGSAIFSFNLFIALFFSLSGVITKIKLAPAHHCAGLCKRTRELSHSFPLLN
ncbi:unnamed protein product [Ixodes pacificus]